MRLAPLVATAAVLCACDGQGKGPAGPATRPAPLVTIAPVEVRDLPITLRAPVDLRPLAVADVGSKTLGYLDAVLVDRGDRVHRGQLLALVRPSDLPDQLAAARGALAQAESSRVLARTNFDRARALAPSAVVSQQELQQAQSALASAEASEVGSRAQIAALGVRLGETRIVSPLTGVVAARRLDPGSLVGPATGNILTVVRIDVLRVFISLTERNAGSVTIGKEAFVELDAFPGRRFHGKVSRVAPGFDPTTRTLEAEVQLPNESGDLRPGMYGRATLMLDRHPRAMVIPAGAVQIADERHFVFVHAAGAVRRTEVQIGFAAEELLEVTRGLSPGAEIVVNGVDLVFDGAKVRTTRAVRAIPEPPRP